MTRVVRLRTNRLDRPVGIDPEDVLTLTWELDTSQRNVLLQSAEVELRSESGDSWTSDQQPVTLPLLHYRGPDLVPRTPYRWRVRVWTDSSATPTEWSEYTTFETGLAPDEWVAPWISHDWPVSQEPGPAAYFRRSFELAAVPDRARAYVSALGWYRLFVNGTDVTGDALVPRFTSLNERVEYQTWDVTPYLRPGPNVVGVVVGEGRYVGSNSAFSNRHVFGDRVAARLQLHTGDGSPILSTDGDWVVGEGEIRSSDPKFGESVDRRRRVAGWASDFAAPSGFSPATTVTYAGTMVAPVSPVFGAVDRVEPVSVTKQPGGAFLIDFGQNLTGIVELAPRGPAGTEIELFHSEVLTPDGTIDRDYLAMKPFLKALHQIDRLVLGDESSDGAEVFRPSFTVHGFRYVEIRGLDSVTEADATAIVMSTKLDYDSAFTSSNTDLDRLHENVRWSMLGNFMDVPADCPTRERSGWTGDAQVFAPTATLYADVLPFFQHWLADLAIEQYPDGCVGDVVPRESRPKKPGQKPALAGAAGWGDAAVLIPWTLYQRTGDLEILRRQYSSMKRWVDFCAHRARTGRAWWRRLRPAGASEEYLADTGFHYGEWLQPGEKPLPTVIRNRLSPPAEVATAFLSHSARILAETAEALGDRDDAAHYTAIADGARSAWRGAVMRSNRLVPDRQASYVRALAFGLVDDNERGWVAARLEELVKESGFTLGTGFLSTPYLLSSLADAGLADSAFRVLLQKEKPSWLYPVTRGATTIWETWHGYDSHDRAVMSHNHYAFGSVAQWLYEGLAGLAPSAPGWSHLRIDPHFGGGIDSVSAHTRTPFGIAATSWRLVDGSVELTVTVPPGATSTVHLPGAITAQESGRSLDAAPGIRSTTPSRGGLLVEIGSGEYEFSWSIA